MKRFILLSVFLMMAGCGDDDVTPPVDMGPGPVDMNAVDMPATDMETDMPVDVDMGPPATTYSGSINVLEVDVLNPGTSGTSFGQGIQASITFHASTDLPPAVLEESPTSALGCKAYEYTAAEAVIASLGNDEGPVQITAAAGTAIPTFPACVFMAGAGYVCPEGSTAQVGGTIAAGPSAGTASLTDTDTTFTAATTTNRYVSISGAATAANNGAFPIVALIGANTIVYGNPAFVAEVLPAAATHVNLAAVGPTPSAPEPGFLDNDNTMEFTLTPGGGMHLPAFTATTGSNTVGDDFVLDLATLNLLNAIPVTGAEITIGCTAATCGTASGMVVSITTTDAPTAGLSPFAMPMPTTKRVVVQCAELAATSITIPAAYSALLMTSGATRMRTTVIRPTLMTGTTGVDVSAISGHAIVGFTNIP